MREFPLLFEQTAPISAPSSSGSRDEPNKKSGPKTRSFHLWQARPPADIEKKARVTELLRRIEDIVAPTVVGMGFELVRVAMSKGGGTLQIMIEPADGGPMDVEACATLSRALSAVLDVEDPIPQAYSLEVSSPGIDRPLRTEQLFRYYAGSEAKIQLAHGIPTPQGAERKNFRGMLKGAADGKLSIEVDGQEFHLPIDDVEHAKLVPDWDAVMKGGSGVGKPEPKPAKPGGKVSKKRQHNEKQG